MGRPESSDFLQSFRFHVKTTEGFIEHEDATRGEAGFQSVSMPEMSVDMAEYREGHFAYTQKQPGIPTVTDITMMRGVTKRDRAFYNAVRRSIGDDPDGGGTEYRTELTIFHWHRDGKVFGQIGDLDAARKYICYEAFATRVKIAGDLDSTSTEVSLAEVDFACEYFEIVDPA